MLCMTFSLHFTSVHSLKFLYYSILLPFTTQLTVKHATVFHFRRTVKYSNSMRDIEIVAVTLASLLSPFVRSWASRSGTGAVRLT